MARPGKKTNPKPAAAQDALTITRQQQKPLSKPQQAFNRLAKRIEKLQKELTETEKMLSGKLEYYGKHVHPLELETSERRSQVAKLLFPFFTDKKLLPKRDKTVLRQILTAQLNNIFSTLPEEPDDELKQIFATLEGMSLEEAEKQDAENMKNELSDLFKSFGFEMNFDGLEADMSPEEITAKMMEMQEDMFRQAENFQSQQKPRKKTKKQLEKEEREKQVAEAKNKNIGRIYKQLAKVLHPDLEQDPEQKAYKELRMRELTAAYEKNDLHTLLRLELEWLQNEENNLDQLTEEKLTIYNQVLKEQAAELEEQIEEQLQHPRYGPLHKFVMFPQQLNWLDLTKEKKKAAELLKTLDKSINNLKSENAMQEVKEIISVFRNYQKNRFISF